MGKINLATVIIGALNDFALSIDNLSRKILVMHNKPHSLVNS
jgi:hypothetical protein